MLSSLPKAVSLRCTSAAARWINSSFHGSKALAERSGALALKLSQLEYVHREIGEYPVLLLDDVMSELDDSRRAQLLLFIDGRVQTFITVNDKEWIPALPGNAYFKICGGTISEG